MSAPAFTPGPWTFHEPFAGFSKISGPDCQLIFGIAAGGPDEKQDDETCEANAHLIAAAPDLYEALDRLRGYVGSPLCLSDHERERERRQMLVTNAEATLAKARGEQS